MPTHGYGYVVRKPSQQKHAPKPPRNPFIAANPQKVVHKRKVYGCSCCA